jgi:hypothetical protein
MLYDSACLSLNYIHPLQLQLLLIAQFLVVNRTTITIQTKDVAWAAQRIPTDVFSVFYTGTATISSK